MPQDSNLNDERMRAALGFGPKKSDRRIMVENFARWTFFLPVSTVISYLGMKFVELAWRVGFFGEPTDSTARFMMAVIGQSFLGYLFVGIGCVIAPKHRESVALAMLTIGLLFAGAIANDFVKNGLSSTTPFWFWVGDVSLIVGLMFGYKKGRLS